MNLKDHIRSIPDFPQPGILFYDISTLLEKPEAWQVAVNRLAEQIEPYQPDRLIAIESRGFLVAAPLALNLNIGLTMIRKQGKLPGKVISHSYDLEYGSDTIEIQSGTISESQKVVLIDDLLATGGTAAASIGLLRGLGARVVASAFIVELNFLNGRDQLDLPVHSLISYDQ
ncbi:MAG: Adenine phosphoribosyltransferase [Alphaproteobacteria bacterium MarineAlpha11_Bin1]|nr:MAG: Adenine phosphoribosyltransferase [Alphaproteobacteria bacterium MarineAlpha11_Bin1]|tara:strand:- start:3067 stop:3582 length:516 start_codon:yes stop_codon:yes gene_type:complete